MEIVDIDTKIVRTGRRFGTSSAVKAVDKSTFVLLRIAADDGSTGVGEISDIEHPEAMPAMDEIEAELVNFLRGRDPRNINRLTTEMYNAVSFDAFEFHSFQQLALAGVDMALYDLVGDRYDIPVWQLLGGRTRDITTCWVVFTRQEPNALDALREEVQARVEQGFTAFKLKIGEVDPTVDAERIRTVREIAGESADVFVDAQGVWNVQQAIDTIERFEPIGIDGVETPVGHPDPTVETSGHYYDIPLVPSELATVREKTDTPVFEHVLDPQFGIDLAAEDAVDVFTVEACAGGITRADRILSVAEGAGIDARLGSTVELGPGTLAAGALGTASTAVTYPCDLIGPLVYDNSIVESDPDYRDGMLWLPDTPGLGFTLQNDTFD